MCMSDVSVGGPWSGRSVWGRFPQVELHRSSHDDGESPISERKDLLWGPSNCWLSLGLETHFNRVALSTSALSSSVVRCLPPMILLSTSYRTFNRQTHDHIKDFNVGWVLSNRKDHCYKSA